MPSISPRAGGCRGASSDCCRAHRRLPSCGKTWALRSSVPPGGRNRRSPPPLPQTPKRPFFPCSSFVCDLFTGTLSESPFRAHRIRCKVSSMVCVISSSSSSVCARLGSNYGGIISVSVCVCGCVSLTETAVARFAVLCGGRQSFPSHCWHFL